MNLIQIKMKIYFKSFVTLDHQLVTTTYIPEMDARQICQTLEEVLQTRVLKPNTRHSQLRKRLCTSLICEGYPNTYRPEGLLYTTTNEPTYVVPFDMMALTAGQTMSSADYYHGFLPGFGRFRYASIEEMLKQYPDSARAIQALNQFREKYGLSCIEEETMRYNECCFDSEIKITPLALIGSNEMYKALAMRYNLPHYLNISERVGGLK